MEKEREKRKGKRGKEGSVLGGMRQVEWKGKIGKG
jgi:hypothetical protein